MSSRGVQNAFKSLSDLKLWFKSRSGSDLNLSDIPELIPLRWNYFRDNWGFIKSNIKDKAESYQYPDMLITQVDSLTSFIDRQKNSDNKAVNPFSSSKIFTRYYAVWDNIQIAAIPISRQEQGIIDRKLDEISRFTKTDFISIRNSLVSARDELTDTIGLTDEQYNATKNRSAIKTLRSARIDDITLMQTFHSGIRNVDFILANINHLNTATVDPFALARSNANNDDIEIQNGKSGRLVKMNFGDSLQDLAARYLGDSNRWLDIAIANGLKPPYIDEIGEAISLISNGEGNQVNISEVDPSGRSNKDKLFINQVIFISSDTLKFAEQRRIISIKEVPISGELVVELSGEADLDKFKIDENAKVRVYKPNTINSGFLVLIPSEQPLENAQLGEVPFFLQSKSEDEKIAGVDLSVNDNADLVFTPNNDFQLSFGLANALQAVKFKMVSEQGQLPRHSSYGLPSVAGKQARDPEALRQILITSINDMIAADARFDRIEQIDVRFVNGTQFNIGLVVRMAGTGTIVPISFTVNAG